MRIAVVGAGAIGSLVAGYLSFKGEDIILIGRQGSVDKIKKNGLLISGVRGNLEIKLDTAEMLDFTPDLAILATKTQDLSLAIRDNLKFLKAAACLTTQNGIHADNLLSEYIDRDKIISSIVMFGSTCTEPGKVVHNFEGSWIIGRLFDTGDNALVLKVKETLEKIFPVIVSNDLKAMKLLKVFVNANNCLAAILGTSMQETFSDLRISKISICIWKEGLDIIRSLNLRLASLPDFPLERIIKLTSMPMYESAKIFSGIMVNLSREPLYGSILQSIKRGRSSEIDYINGEFVNLAEANNLRAPLNRKLVEMVHQVEDQKKFFTREELIEATKELVN